MSVTELRRIVRRPAVRVDVPVDAVGGELNDVRSWLNALANEYGMLWLLVHADDGVLWGRVDAGELITSHDVAKDDPKVSAISPPLRPDTLQEARLFGPSAELLLWREAPRVFRARLLREVAETEQGDWEEAFDEPHLLWGTERHALSNGFTLLIEGAQGMRHIIPLTPPPGVTGPPKLWFRHYLTRTGAAGVAVSRLMDLRWEEHDEVE